MNEFVILDAMQGLHGPWLDPVVATFTRMGDSGALWIVLGLVLLGMRRTRKLGVAVLVALVLGAIVTNLMIKPLLMRPRPCDVNTAVAMLIPRPHGSSFPSGHTTAAFGAAAALWFARNPKAPWGLTLGVTVAALLMGLSRMYCYVHYPTDVLAGAIVGTLAGLAAALLVDALARRRRPAPDIPRGPGSAA